MDKVLIILYSPRIQVGEGTSFFSSAAAQRTRMQIWPTVGGGLGEELGEHRFQSHRPLINELLL